ncbi:MAG: DNA primase [Lachnospiraceae bacterium]|nr:DNA primase [Lachnospiraceae bacterium]
MAYSRSEYERVIETVDIVDIVSSYIPLERKGRKYWACCPFHDERTPSFNVDSDKNLYYCFSCHKGGNALTFVKEYENLSNEEALERLAQKGGITLQKMKQTDEARREETIKSKIQSINKEAATMYYKMLMYGKEQRGHEYFKERGITDETIKKFGLGYSGIGGDMHSYLVSKGYSDRDLMEAKLFTYKEKKVYDIFFNRVMFPIMNEYGVVIGFGGRVLGDAKPKYLNSQDTKLFNKRRNLYGLNFAKYTKRKYFILCEGYMDTIALHQAGFDCAMASLGTALTEEQAALMARKLNGEEIKRVIISYDSDGAGQTATLRAIPILRNAGITVNILKLDPYKDPDEFIKNLGSEEFEKRIEDSIKYGNAFWFEVEHLEGNYNMEDPGERSQMIHNLAMRIALTFSDKMERESYARTASKKYQIDFENMMSIINSIGKEELLKKQEEDRRRLSVSENAEESGLSTKIDENAGMSIVSAKSKENDNASSEGNGSKETDASKGHGFSGRARRNMPKIDELFPHKQLISAMTLMPDYIPKIRKLLVAEDFIHPTLIFIVRELFEQYDVKKTVFPAKILEHFENEEDVSEVTGIFNMDFRDELDEVKKQASVAECLKKVKMASIDALKKKAVSENNIAEFGRCNELQREFEKFDFVKAIR